jgi:hypothetical protein
MARFRAHISGRMVKWDIPADPRSRERAVVMGLSFRYGLCRNRHVFEDAIRVYEVTGGFAVISWPAW